MRKTLVRLRKEGNVEDAAYILMQRIFPPVYPTIFVRDGICYKDPAISELGIFGAYLRYATVISHIGWEEEGKENKTPFIRVWKSFPSRRALKTLRVSPKGKAQRGQYLLAVGLGRYSNSVIYNFFEII